MGYDDAHLKMIVEKNQVCHKIDVHLKKRKAKGIAIDGVPEKNLLMWNCASWNTYTCII